MQSLKSLAWGQRTVSGVIADDQIHRKHGDGDLVTSLQPSQPDTKEVAATSAGIPPRAAESVTTGYLGLGAHLPFVIKPAATGLDLTTWARNNRGLLEERLLQAGAILFRNFDLSSTEEFERLIDSVSGKLMDYSYRSTPRTLVSGHIYTSTEYPAHQSIPLHNELSYSRSWPMKLWFFCMRVAEQQGETPIADSRKIYQHIPVEIRTCFERKGLMYVRNYGTGVDLDWEDVFQTNSRQEVEDYCRAEAIELEWIGDSQLRTRQRCQVSMKHPQTGEMVWFNQAHIFHVSRLPTEVRESLLAIFAEADLPRNVYFADGTAIDPALVDEVLKVYKQQAVVFPWSAGDVLLVDNMLTAHGRNPFRGKRRVVVGMSQENDRTV